MTAVSAAKATSNAAATRTNTKGMCLKYVRTWLEIPSRYPDARSAWNAATRKHRGDRNPPAGAPMFFRGGDHDHIVLSMGSARARSTDTPVTGTVSTQDLDWWEQHWQFTYLGWTADLNGVVIPWLVAAPPIPPPQPVPVPPVPVPHPYQGDEMFMYIRALDVPTGVKGHAVLVEGGKQAVAYAPHANDLSHKGILYVTTPDAAQDAVYDRAFGAVAH